MRPRRDDETLVDVIDVLLRDGAIVRADVIVSVADIPLVGIKLTAAIAGMETMTEYGIFEEWDADYRRRAIDRRQNENADSREQLAADPPDRLTVGHRDGADSSGTETTAVEGDSDDGQSDDRDGSSEPASDDR